MGRKATDLTGKVVGKLTVVERHYPDNYRGGKHAEWVCSCECGGVTIKKADDLRRTQFMSCGCVEGNPAKRSDHTGIRYGKATGLYETGEVKFSQRVWKWKCDCGEEFESVAGGYVHKGYSPGCDKCVSEENFKRLSAQSTTHGMSQTKEWKAWSKVRDRVFNPNSPDFKVYSPLGMDESLSSSFENFHKEIGPCPVDGQKWSVGRIDNDVGYRVGNLRWETNRQQSCNKGRMSNNKSGVTGVHVEEKIHPNGKNSTTYAIAQWHDIDGKIQKKSFSYKKYGEELAFLAACEARDQSIRLLKQQGLQYSDKHGL